MNKALSPCIGLCRIERRSGLCEGCLRSLTEIADWPMLSRGEKLAVLDKLSRRRLTGGN